MSTGPRAGRARLRLLGLFGAFLFIVLSARLVWVQVIRAGHYRAAGQKQHIERVRHLPHRGRIVDRNGIPLAYTVSSPSVMAITANLRDRKVRRAVARKLSPLLEEPVDRLERLMAKRQPVVELNRKPTRCTAEELEALDLPGIRVELQPKRVYPLGAAAAHVTGFVGVDQDGIEGTEKAFDSELQGTPGWQTFRRDAHGGKHPYGYERPAVPGRDLVLTVDAYLQEVAAGCLERAVTKSRARAGWAIVMDPRNGDVLAMVNIPTYDPTSFDEYPAANYRNHVISDRIEPGSTVKAITAAAALEEGVMRPGTLVDCHEGRWVLQGKAITDDHELGVIPFIDTFVHSSNIGMAQVGLKLGDDRMYHYFKKFGLGRKSGVGLRGEDSGYLKDRDRWSARTAASMAFGYEVQTTALQIALAYGALANDGILMKPRLVREVLTPEGDIVRKTEPQQVRRVVTSETADRMLEFMGRVVAEGTARQAAVDWCWVGGKTGTARKVDPKTRRYTYKHYASFVGVAPIHDPRLLVYIVIDEPKGNIYGGSTAGPAFREIIEAAGKAPEPLLRPDYETVQVGPLARTIPRPEVLIRSAGQERHAAAVADTLAAHRAESDAGPPIAGPPVPDLTGLSLRQALRRIDEAGLAAGISGEGVVVGQYPAAGRRLRPGAKVTIFLGSRNDIASRETR